MKYLGKSEKWQQIAKKYNYDEKVGNKVIIVIFLLIAFIWCVLYFFAKYLHNDSWVGYIFPATIGPIFLVAGIVWYKKTGIWFHAMPRALSPFVLIMLGTVILIWFTIMILFSS